MPFKEQIIDAEEQEETPAVRRSKKAFQILVSNHRFQVSTNFFLQSDGMNVKIKP